MITEEQIWKGPDAVRRDVTYASDVTDEIRQNVVVTTELVNELLRRYELATSKVVNKVNSGWRPPAVNESTSNAAKASKHLSGQGVDLDDDNGDLARWLMTDEGLDAMIEIGLWMEHPGWTVGWVHLQTVPPGNPPRPSTRIYIPSTKAATTKAFGLQPVNRAIS